MRSPDVNVQLQAPRCGLDYSEELERNFKAEFWITLQDHRSCSAQIVWAMAANRPYSELLGASVARIQS